MKWKNLLLMILLVMAMAYSATAQLGDSNSGAQLQLSLLNQDPNPAPAGGTATVRLKFENRGGQPANNLQIEVQPSYPFTVADGNNLQTVGSVNAFQTDNNYAQVQYTIKISPDAHEGSYDLQVRYNYGSGGSWITQKFPIAVTNKEFAQLMIDKSQLSPGQETKVTFTISNKGSAPLQNIAFSWTEPTGAVLPVYSDNTKYVQYLGIGQSVNLTYNVVADVNANPGLYQMQMTLKFESMTNTTISTAKTTAGIFVGGQTDFDVAFSESSVGQTSLSVANIGNNPAQSVTVIIPDQQGYRVTGSSSAIIGNLAKGDYTIVSFQIAGSQARATAGSGGTSQQAAAKPAPLKVTVQYTDTTGHRQSAEKEVPIQFRAATSTGTTTTTTGTVSRTSSGTNWYLMIGLLLAGLVAGFFYGRRKSKAKK
ncbi:MAG: COG1361 S-layer family protein [Candidatus Woesearchaeota archaeon]